MPPKYFSCKSDRTYLSLVHSDPLTQAINTLSNLIGSWWQHLWVQIKSVLDATKSKVGKFAVGSQKGFLSLMISNWPTSCKIHFKKPFFMNSVFTSDNRIIIPEAWDARNTYQKNRNEKTSYFPAAPPLPSPSQNINFKSHPAIRFPNCEQRRSLRIWDTNKQNVKGQCWDKMGGPALISIPPKQRYA